MFPRGFFSSFRQCLSLCDIYHCNFQGMLSEIIHVAFYPSLSSKSRGLIRITVGAISMPTIDLPMKFRVWLLPEEEGSCRGHS